MAVPVYHNYIGGQWVPAKSGQTLENENPATGELLGLFPDSGAEDVAEAMAAGQAALDTYTEGKTIYVDYSGRLQKAQIDR